MLWAGFIWADILTNPKNYRKQSAYKCHAYYPELKEA